MVSRAQSFPWVLRRVLFSFLSSSTARDWGHEGPYGAASCHRWFRDCKLTIAPPLLPPWHACIGSVLAPFCLGPRFRRCADQAQRHLPGAGLSRDLSCVAPCSLANEDPPASIPAGSMSFSLPGDTTSLEPDMRKKKCVPSSVPSQDPKDVWDLNAAGSLLVRGGNIRDLIRFLIWSYP
jgi:hypothetical protein